MEVDLLSLDDAIGQLSALEPVHAEIVRMRFFTPATLHEIAEALEPLPVYGSSRAPSGALLASKEVGVSIDEDPEQYRELADLYRRAVECDEDARKEILREVSRSRHARSLESPCSRTMAPGSPSQCLPRSHRCPRGSGPYAIQSTLGRGGMGVVYLASHEVTGHRVALKLCSGTASATEAELKRFAKEQQALARLEQPGDRADLRCRDLHDGVRRATLLLDGSTSKGRRWMRSWTGWARTKLASSCWQPSVKASRSPTRTSLFIAISNRAT